MENIYVNVETSSEDETSNTSTQMKNFSRCKFTK